MLLASYCFARSERSPRRPVEVVVVILVVTVVSVSLSFDKLPLEVKCVIGGLALVGLSVIVFVVPTIKDDPRR